jgi:hypothetical protein
MITISSYQHQSLQRPVQVGRIGNGLAELVKVTAPLALAAAMMALVVNGIHACARSTVTCDALNLLRWRSTWASFPTAFAGQLGLHPQGLSTPIGLLGVALLLSGAAHGKCEQSALF